MKYYKFYISDAFDLEKTLSCGQCFRWEKNTKNGNNGFYGIVNDSKKSTAYYAEISQFEEKKANHLNQNKILKIKTTGGSKNFWQNYFDLDRNYDEINKILSKNDKLMKKAISFGKGIRILNQDFEEIVFSFIISANNNIKRISKNINGLSKHFGEKIYQDKKYLGNAFPTKKVLSKISLSNKKYLSCKLGYREKYLIETAKMLYNKNDSIENEDNIKNHLEKLTGVGEKVKACIELFSLKKFDAFPVDTWIKKALKEFYHFEASRKTEIEGFVKKKWGENAGLAQQYLFYYMMNGTSSN